MKLSNILFREKSAAVIKQTVTFNAPGTYYPPYGKTDFLLQAQGQPGNPSSGGNYAGSNPGSGGNFAGWNYNPGNPGSNPPSGGNPGTNPSTPGNYAGVTGGVATQNKTYSGPNAGVNSSSYTAGTAPNCPPNVSTWNSPNNLYTETYNCTPYYNPPTPGNPYTNPIVPGNNYTNPPSQANANYNPYYPGNANYNPYVSGNAGSNYNVLGVSLPGGNSDTAAPVVGYVPIAVDYTTSGISITCPPGGYVKIQNL